MLWSDSDIGLGITVDDWWAGVFQSFFHCPSSWEFILGLSPNVLDCIIFYPNHNDIVYSVELFRAEGWIIVHGSIDQSSQEMLDSAILVGFIQKNHVHVSPDFRDVIIEVVIETQKE